MEAIKQTVDVGAIALLGIVAVAVIIGMGFVFDKSIITMDEEFKVIGDASRYICVVSEVENDLLLNCLKVK